MLRRFAGGSRPWLLETHFVQPHDPYFPLKQYFDRYDPRSIPVPRSFHDTFVGKPGLHRRESSIWGNVTEATTGRAAPATTPTSSNSISIALPPNCPNFRSGFAARGAPQTSQQPVFARLGRPQRGFETSGRQGPPLLARFPPPDCPYFAGKSPFASVALHWKRRFWDCPSIYCTGIVEA